MKGLLYKDLSCLFGAYRTNFILVFAVYFLLSLVAGASYLAWLLVVVIGLYLPGGASLDEDAHWDAYARTLPVTPRQLVGSKYLLELALVTAGAVLALVVLLPASASPFASGPPVGMIAVGLIGSVCAALLIFSLHMPLLYRFGAVRARAWLTVVVAVIGLGPAFVVAMVPTAFNTLAAAVRSVEQALGPYGPTLGIVALTLAVFGVSYAASVQIYRRKVY